MPNDFVNPSAEDKLSVADRQLSQNKKASVADQEPALTDDLQEVSPDSLAQQADALSALLPYVGNSGALDIMGVSTEAAAETSDAPSERRKAILDRIQARRKREAYTDPNEKPIYATEDGLTLDSIADPSFKSSESGIFDKNRTIWPDVEDKSQKPWKVSKGTKFKLLNDKVKEVGGIKYVEVNFEYGKSKEILKGWVKQHGTNNRAKRAMENISEPIFEKGQIPRPEDVKQGGLGDCYFMAALASVAAQKPQAILNMFRSDPYDPNVNRIIVRFFKVKTDYTTGEKSYTPSFVAIDKSLLTLERTSGSDDVTFDKRIFAKGNAIWPGILEKAYAAWPHRNEHASNSQTSYEGIGGGHGHHALEHITGEAFTAYSVSSITQVERFSGKYSVDLEKLYAVIDYAVKSKEFLTIATKHSWVNTDLDSYTASKGKSANENIKGGLAAQHVYSILGTEEKNGLKFILIRNPWGEMGQRAKTNIFGKFSGYEQVEGAAGAISKIELSDIPRHFSDLSLKQSLSGYI